MIPETVIIGDIVYRIEQGHKLLGTGSDGESIWLDGRVRWEEALIQVDDDVDAQVVPVIILHEAMHAMLSHAGFKKHPEKALRALAFGMRTFIRENPEFMDTLRNGDDTVARLRTHIEDMYTGVPFRPTGCGGSFEELLCHELHGPTADAGLDPWEDRRATDLTFQQLARKWCVSLDELGLLIHDHCRHLEMDGQQAE